MRHTYDERRIYSAKVMRFRQAVYADRAGMTNGCRLLLLRLSDDMDAKGYVSVPRSALADHLGVAPARITEWIKAATSLGFLDRVRRGRPGVTAVYAAKVPALGTPGRTPLEVRESRPRGVRPGVPLSGPQRYATAVPQEGEQTEGIETAGTSRTPRRGSEDQDEGMDAASRPTACEAHGWADCLDRECLDAEARRTAS